MTKILRNIAELDAESSGKRGRGRKKDYLERHNKKRRFSFIFLGKKERGKTKAKALPLRLSFASDPRLKGSLRKESLRALSIIERST